MLAAEACVELNRCAGVVAEDGSLRGPSFCVGADVGHVAEAGHASHTDGGTDADAHGPDGRGHAVARLRAEDQQSYRGAVAGLAKHFARSPDTLETLTEAELRVFFLELVTTRQVFAQYADGLSERDSISR